MARNTSGASTGEPGSAPEKAAAQPSARPSAQPSAGTRAAARTMTSPMLKAMASPLRRQVMSVLAAQDYARATDLAGQLGVAANKLSYHLRILADAGMIQEAPQFARDNRDRVWQAVDETYRLGSPEDPLGASEEYSLGAYLSQMELDQHAALSKVLAWAPDFATGRDADPKAELSIGTLRLTRGEAIDFFHEIERVVKAARKLHREPGGSGVKTWEYTFMAVREDL